MRTYDCIIADAQSPLECRKLPMKFTLLVENYNWGEAGKLVYNWLITCFFIIENEYASKFCVPI